MPYKDPEVRKLKMRIYQNRYTAKRTPEDKARVLELQVQRRSRIKQEINSYKAGKGCFDCGEKDPVVLDFDHLEGFVKKANVADLVNGGLALKTIFEEILKCELVCANCHRRRTHRRKSAE